MKTKFTLLLVLLSLNSTFSQSKDVELKQLKINNDLDHFAARVVGQKIYFSSNLVNRREKPLKDNFGQSIYGLYEGEFDGEGEITNVKPIEKMEIGTFNMSIATFSSDGKYMYFTSNADRKAENKIKGYNTRNLIIQRAEYIEGRGWVNFTTLPFCNPENNFGHPALSPDGSTLYFFADLKGKKGKSDLYKVSVSNHETYGEVERLNDSINSSRSEGYPFVSADNKLYFTSDRRGGKGGLDIYVYDLESDDENQEAVCLDDPINTIGDDFSFFLNDDLTTGYLSSRRTRGEGGDDLYYFNKF
ncbi:hypothetical protein [Winogradskyella sp. SYSU M77433]|uniref:hypothetical protein n=1 Tax=Winogradskyella sp. SYSU M77433 TaxID=3042722 RepID=UPI0024813E01|nr:hypothetical protein [Winogradskyella sp. SYSU M77433]MDH7914165.1 hypothetical protein [Winogradskyella sp. SYSU M77433]